jgi:hypothetical protein
MEGEYVNMWKEDGILFVEYGDNLGLNQDIASEVIKNRLVFQQNKEYPVFCDTSGVNDTNLQALEKFATEGVLLVSAIAFYTKTPLDYYLTEYFIKTYKIKISAKIFKHKFEALQFLKPYIQ